jgi:uncharacterized delta-60 repeat protein
MTRRIGMKKSRIAHLSLYRCFRSSVGLLLMSAALAVSGCSGENSPPAANAPAIITLNSETMPVPISATEADRFFAVAAATGNRYYAAGFTTVTDDSQMAIARFGETGGLDASFGSNGIATVNVAVGTGKKAELARAVVIQSDGKVVIAGPIEHDATATGDAARDTDIAVARFDTTGQLDPTFGANGITRLDLSTGTVSGTAFRGDTVWGLTLLPGDNLLVVGGKLADGPDRTDIDYAVVKLTASGAADTTFGTNGLVTLDIGTGSDNPRTAIVQPDGKIVVSGHTSDAGVITTVLFRLLPNGQFDSTFGRNGVVHVALLAFVAEAYDVALQGQNLIIGGYGRHASTGTVDIISARFLANGTWDMTYGDGGVAVIDVASQDDRGRTLKVLPDQRVLIVGQGKQTATTQEGAVVLLTPNGQRETRLSGNGVALVDFGGPTDALFGLALSPDLTRAVAVGWRGVNASESSPTNNDDARILRFSLPTQS